jgi:hypothetical protein
MEKRTFPLPKKGFSLSLLCNFFMFSTNYKSASNSAFWYPFEYLQKEVCFAHINIFPNFLPTKQALKTENFFYKCVLEVH